MKRATLRRRISQTSKPIPLHPRQPIPISAATPASALHKSDCSCGGSCPSCQGEWLAGPDHPAEREADAVAAQVMAMPESAEPIQRMADDVTEDQQWLQRQVDKEEESLQLQPEEEEETLQLQPEEEEEEETLQLQVEDEEEETLQARAEPGGALASTGNPLSGLGPGRPLPASLRKFFEPRFGRSFAGVRIHDDDRAQARARRFRAQAFTYGQDIVFGPGRYSPESREGRRLLAHELTHVVQQRAQKTSKSVQRTAASCPSGWSTTVQDDHDRAIRMIDKARSDLSAYNGTTPAKVKTALDRHFKASSIGFAGWVNFNLGFLRSMAPLASYDCEDTGSWWCSSGNNAKTFWCVPFVDIRVCEPAYFSQSDIERSETLIHEWVHKYGCNFDLGYSDEPDYPNQWTITALVSADPWSEFVQDVQ